MHSRANLYTIAILLYATLFISTPSYSKIKREKKAKKSVPSSTDYSSRANRGSKSFGVVGEIGLVNVLAFARGLRGFVYLDNKTLIEMGVLDAEISFFGYSTKYLMVESRYKRILGNSFYYFAGLAMQSTTSVNPDFYGNQSSKLSSKNLGIEAGIGNHWSWSGFTMGCDWVGAVEPVITLSKSESFPDGGDEIKRQSDKDEFESKIKSTNLMLVRFYLGMHF